MKTSWIMLAVAAASLTCAGAALAAGIDLPARKPGQWEIKMMPRTGGAAPAMTSQLCLDAKSDRSLMAKGLAMSTGCTTQQSKDAAGNMVFDAVCNIAGRKTKSHAVVSGDFNSHYAIDITTDSEGGPPGMPKHMEITQQASWVGACKAGMKPGDMTMPNGRTINLLGLMQPQG